MKIQFRESFRKDVDKISDRSLVSRIVDCIKDVERAKDIHTISSLKKLKGKGSYWSIRIGDYRLGCVRDGDVFVFVRCLHRKEIYRYFP